MCLGAVPLAMKAFGASNKSAALTAISPALGIMSALKGKNKSQPAPMVTGGVAGPSPSYGG